MAGLAGAARSVQEAQKGLLRLNPGRFIGTPLAKYFGSRKPEVATLDGGRLCKAIMNKLFLAVVLGLVPLLSFGQGTALRATNGIGSGYTFYGESTNRGLTIWLGSSALGTTYALIDTNGLNRIAIAGRSMTFRDTNNIRLRIDGHQVGSSGVTGAVQILDVTGTLAAWVSSNGVVHGNGGGLTNLASATNFPAGPTYVYNGKVTFNSNVVVNMVSYNTNAWSGPTNSLILGTNYLNYIATGDCNITNVSGQDATLITWSTLTISNSTASSITARITASGVRLQGSATTASLPIAAGKEAMITIQCRGVLSTNMVTTAQQ